MQSPFQANDKTSETNFIDREQKCDEEFKSLHNKEKVKEMTQSPFNQKTRSLADTSVKLSLSSLSSTPKGSQLHLPRNCYKCSTGQLCYENQENKYKTYNYENSKNQKANSKKTAAAEQNNNDNVNFKDVEDFDDKENEFVDEIFDRYTYDFVLQN